MASKDWPRGQPPYVPPSNDGVTRVVHMKLYKGDVIQDCDVYIGRRNCMGGWNLPQSKWANPFKMREYKNDRKLVVEEYRKYVLSKPELLESLQELEGKRLGCWCKPEQCHGDILVELVNKFCADDHESAKLKTETAFDLNEDFPSLGSKPAAPDAKQAAYSDPPETLSMRDGYKMSPPHGTANQKIYNAKKTKTKDWPRGQPPYVPSSNDGVTRVVHMKLYKGDVIQDCDVYIGRENRSGGWNLPQSKWANPFQKHEYKEKNIRIQKYRDYITSKPELLGSLNELKGKRLGCWCKPEQCHGDVLVELVEKFSADDKPRKPKIEAVCDLNKDFPSLEPKLTITPQQIGGMNPQQSGSPDEEGKLQSAADGIKQEERRPASRDGKSKRKKHRTPHLHMTNTNTPKWHASNDD